MAALHALPAVLTAAAMHAKPNVVELGLGDFGLVLIDNFGLTAAAAAVRTVPGQLGFQRFIHPGGNRTMGLAAVATASFASWFLGIGLGSASGKGSRLTLRRSQRFFHLTPQPLVFLPQPLDLAFQARYLFRVCFLIDPLSL